MENPANKRDDAGASPTLRNHCPPGRALAGREIGVPATTGGGRPDPRSGNRLLPTQPQMVHLAAPEDSDRHRLLPHFGSRRSHRRVFPLRAARYLLQLLPYGEYFLMGSRKTKGHTARGRTPFRLSIMACLSEVRVVCREAGTCLCASSAAQPLQWPQAFRWDRLERKLPW
jgi:hypothetical protein